MGSAVRVGTLAGVPTKGSPGPLPTTRWPLPPLSQAPCLSLFSIRWSPEAQLPWRGVGTELALNTVVLTPWKGSDVDMAPTPIPKHCLAAPCPEAVGCLVASPWPLLALLCGSHEGCPWEQRLELPVSFIRGRAHRHPQGLPP